MNKIMINNYFSHFIGGAIWLPHPVNFDFICYEPIFFKDSTKIINRCFSIRFDFKKIEMKISNYPPQYVKLPSVNEIEQN